MGVVSVRLNLETEAYLKARKLKPGPFAKEAVEAEVRRRIFRETMDHFRKHPVKTPKSSVEMIREDRDHAH